MRWFLILLLLAGPALSADPVETEAFAAAAKASQDNFFERAEKSWSDFLNRFPNSERAHEAALALAQARHQLKQFPAALQALANRLSTAGPLADQFQFWRAQTLLDMTNYSAAETGFSEFLKTFTNSPLRLNAAVGQATARFRREDFAGVLDLLSSTNSVFQQLARESTNTALIARGFFTLAESQLLRNDLPGARASLQGLAGRPLPAELEWERLYLLARIEFAGPAPGDALAYLTQARAIKRPALLTQALNLEAEIHKRLNQPARAAQSYEALIAAEGIPPEQKRLALLKQVELAAAQNAFTNAAARINLYLTQNPQDPIVDQLNLKAGELLLEAYRAETNKLGAPATNYINQARAYFDATLQLTNSSNLGRAWLNRAWSFWEEHQAAANPQRLAESHIAFQAAAEKLPPGDERAQARLKLGETQFKQTQYAGAATNFEAVLNTPNLNTNLLAHAAQQLLRTQLAQTNLPAAEAALRKLTNLLPDSTQAQQSWLDMALACAELRQFEKSRALLANFPALFPNSALKADAQLAYARTFALEENWPQTIELYSAWTAANTNHPALAQAEFDRAWFHKIAGQETNAFQLLTNFVARFPTNELAARAQYIIGDYYFNFPREQWSLAEQSYQRVFLSTNWNAGELACQARLNAARAAFFRQSYADAQSYLTNLLNTACSPDIIAEAYFVLGDVLIELRVPNSTTNTFDNYRQALAPFDRVTRTTNRFEPLAWGKIGDCHFQLAAAIPESYVDATNAYFKLLNSPRADLATSHRNKAEFQIGATLEKMAALNQKERRAFLQQALDHYLNIIYGAPGRPSAPEWQSRAALPAIRLTEILNPSALRALYDRLIIEIPALKTTWEIRRNALPEAD